MADAVATPRLGARLLDVAALGKPRLSLMVVFTASVGLVLAPGALAATNALLFLFATSTLVFAANALNCWVERDTDGLMRRTRNRPLPAGRVEPWVGLTVGIVTAALAIPALALATNVLTASLGTLAFVSYVFVYTPMKRHSWFALVVGAVPGALPPLMGWTAVTGSMDPGGLALFGVMFFWQLPHFLAVSYYLCDDYTRGGHAVFSATYGQRVTRLVLALTVVALIPASYLPVAYGVGGDIYFVAAATLGLGFLAYSLNGSSRQRGGTRWARGVFLASLVYLTLLFAVLLIAPGA